MTDETRYWNIWWVLALISAAITFLAGLLEALGVWRDLGLGIGIMGTAATLFFGFTATMQSDTLRTIDRRLDQMHDTLLHILRIPVVNGANQTGSSLNTNGWASGATTLNKGDTFTIAAPAGCQPLRGSQSKSSPVRRRCRCRRAR